MITGAHQLLCGLSPELQGLHLPVAICIVCSRWCWLHWGVTLSSRLRQAPSKLADLLTCNLCWPFFQKLEAELADLPAFKRCCMAKQAAQLVTELA